MGSDQSSLSIGKNSQYESIHEDWPWVWGIRDPKYLDWKKNLSNDEIQAQALRQQNLPVSVTENVYWGSAMSVESKISQLQTLGITSVLNMAGHALKAETAKEYEKYGIKFKRIDAEDENDYDLLGNHWDEAYEFIKSSTEDGKGKCVVHCVAGINRSGLIVAAYHMLLTKSTVFETVKHIRAQRGNLALSNEGFQQQLVAIARLNDLLGAKPGTEGSIIHEKSPPADNDWPSNQKKIKRENPLDRLAF